MVQHERQNWPTKLIAASNNAQFYESSLKEEQKFDFIKTVTLGVEHSCEMSQISEEKLLPIVSSIKRIYKSAFYHDSAVQCSE